MRLTLVLATIPILSCGGNVAKDSTKTPEAIQAELRKFAQGVGEADAVVLFEGLPHQTYDGDALKKDLKEKKTVQLHGFPFYAETLPLNERDAAELKRLVSDLEAYSQANGTKKCGGFHPDYCIEWTKGGEKFRVLVCFGCGEVKFFGPKIELYCDTEHVRGGFADSLKSYQRNRPSWEGLYRGQAPALKR